MYTQHGAEPGSKPRQAPPWLSASSLLPPCVPIGLALCPDGPLGRDVGSCLNMVKERTDLRTEKSEQTQGVQPFWWACGALREHYWLEPDNGRADSGWALTRELSSWSLKGLTHEEEMDFRPFWGNFECDRNPFSYIASTQWSQCFLLIGSDSTLRKLPVSCSTVIHTAVLQYFATSSWLP